MQIALPAPFSSMNPKVRAGRVREDELIVSNVNLSDKELLDRTRMALDSAVPAQIIKSQRNLQHGMNLLYLFFSHAFVDLRTLCFRAILMQHGKIFEPRHVAEFFYKPSYRLQAKPCFRCH